MEACCIWRTRKHGDTVALMVTGLTLSERFRSFYSSLGPPHVLTVFYRERSTERGCILFKATEHILPWGLQLSSTSPSWTRIRALSTTLL